MLDNMRVHMQIWFEYLSSVGVVLEPANFYKFAAGRTNAEILYELLSPNLTQPEILEHSQKKEELYRRHYGPILKPVPGLPEFLAAARQLGIPMAVASSAGCENIQFHLDGLDSADFFSALVGSEDVRNGKPDPEIFLQAASRLGVPVEECLVFEDTPAGLEAAARAGMRAIAVTTTYPAERLAENPVVLKIVPDYTTLQAADLLNL